jgi:hypothetical protein
VQQLYAYSIIYYELNGNRLKELEAQLGRKSERKRLLQRQLEQTQDDLRKVMLEKQVLSHDSANLHATCEKLTELLRETEEKSLSMSNKLAFQESKLQSIF